jgi:cutinase
VTLPRRFARTAAVLAAFATATAGVLVSAPIAGAVPCPDIEIVFARGTGEPAGVGRVGQAFTDALSSQVGGRAVTSYAVNYPADYDFLTAADGASDANSHIASMALQCPSTKIVLGGYSQGAAVAGYTTTDSVPDGIVLPDGIAGTLPPAIASHVAAVVLFGTPSDWFLNLVAHDAPPITIGHLYSAKTLELCATGDPICFPGGRDRAAHSSYKDNGMADQAADFAVHALTARV